MKLNKYLFISIIAICTFGCISSDYFGLYQDANIIAFDIEGQQSNKIEPMADWRDTGVVNITVPTTLQMSNLKVTKATVAQLARFNKDPYAITDFTKNIVLTVTAEDTVIKKPWKVIVKYAEASDQIPFSAFNEWTIAKNNDGKEISFKESGVTKYAYFPGKEGELSPWQTAAESNALSIAGINYITTSPQPSASAAQYAHIETIWKSKGAPALANAQIVTGTLFTGQFIFNLSYAPMPGGNPGEPRKMVNIGTPFYAKPKAIKFKMRYKAGDVMRDGKGQPITASNADGRPTKDSCDIYAILQNRKLKQSENQFVRVAIASYRTSETIGDMADNNGGFVEMTIPFTYGQPTPAEIAAKPYMKIGGSRGELTFNRFTKNGDNMTIEPVTEVYATDPENTEVDYIAVLFSSSAYGDSFWGAVNADGTGSTLDIKDFELVY